MKRGRSILEHNGHYWKCSEHHIQVLLKVDLNFYTSEMGRKTESAGYTEYVHNKCQIRWNSSILGVN